MCSCRRGRDFVRSLVGGAGVCVCSNSGSAPRLLVGNLGTGDSVVRAVEGEMRRRGGGGKVCRFAGEW